MLSGRLIDVRQCDGGVEYRAEDDALLSSYFRLETMSRPSGTSSPAVTRRSPSCSRSTGTCASEPDRWECVVAYICSVERIRVSVDTEALGDRVDVRCTFPTVEREAGEEGLEKLGLGLDKHAKIVAAARHSRGERTWPTAAGGGQDATDGLLRDRAQGRLHRALRPRQGMHRWVRRAMEDRYFPDGVSSDEMLPGTTSGTTPGTPISAQRDAERPARPEPHDLVTRSRGDVVLTDVVGGEGGPRSAM